MTAAEFRESVAALGLSQTDAADFLGVSLRTINAQCNGLHRVRKGDEMLLRSDDSHRDHA